MENFIEIYKNILPTVTEFGLFQVDEPWLHRQRLTDKHTLILILEGVMYVNEDYKDFEVPKGHIIFFKGGCEQKGTSFIPAGSKWYWINFKYDNIQCEHENISIPLPKKFQLPIQNNIISIICEMEILYNSNLSFV